MENKSYSESLFVQIHFSTYSSLQHDKNALLSGIRRAHFSLENLWPAFMQKSRGGQRVAPAPAIFQVLSAQNNQYSRAAYFGVICSRLLPDQHPRHFSSGDWMLTICIVHIILDLLSHIVGVMRLSHQVTFG